jgi:hypothetical protein
MVHLPKPIVIISGNNLISIEFTWHKSIHCVRLEFITDCFEILSLSPEGNDSRVIFMGMVHSGSPSLHTILDESISEEESASSDMGTSGFPISQGCNVVTPVVPNIAILPPEGTSVLLTILMTPLRTTVPQPNTRLLPERLWDYQ